MKIPQIERTSPTFGVYKGTKLTPYGLKDTGVFKGYKLDIYKVNEGKKVTQKLYYLADSAGKWVKSKLVFFENGKKVHEIRGAK